MTESMHLPDGATIRAAAWDDLDQVVALMAAQNLAHYGEPLTSPESLRQAWQAPGLDLERDTWVAVGSEGRLTGYAELLAESPTRCFLAHCLADGTLDAEAGAQMIQLAEARAAALGGGQPIRLVTRIHGRDLAARRLFEDAGFGPTMSFLVMEIALPAPPPAPEWPAGITPRPFVPSLDDQATYRADEEASEDKGYHTPMTFDEWAARMSMGRDFFDPALWFLACEGECIAGVALNFIAPGRQTGWVDHLGVRRPWRGRGLGLALLRHSFNAFYAHGISHVRLSVDAGSPTGAPRLYERAGMQTLYQYHIYAKTVAG